MVYDSSQFVLNGLSDQFSISRPDYWAKIPGAAMKLCPSMLWYKYGQRYTAGSIPERMLECRMEW